MRTRPLPSRPPSASPDLAAADEPNEATPEIHTYVDAVAAPLPRLDILGVIVPDRDLVTRQLGETIEVKFFIRRMGIVIGQREAEQ